MATPKRLSRTSDQRSDPAVEAPGAAVGVPGARFPIVGLGASAGGLEAFELSFRRIPVDIGMGFVLVQDLETSKEELQSVNEEMKTVNTEWQTRIERMASLHDDMKNLRDNLRVGTIVLDTLLVIRRFTRDATRIYRLVNTDLGRPLPDIPSELQDVDLLADATDAGQPP